MHQLCSLKNGPFNINSDNIGRHKIFYSWHHLKNPKQQHKSFVIAIQGRAYDAIFLSDLSPRRGGYLPFGVIFGSSELFRGQHSNTRRNSGKILKANFAFEVVNAS
jgi:hypothetical protein